MSQELALSIRGNAPRTRAETCVVRYVIKVACLQNEVGPDKKNKIATNFLTKRGSEIVEPLSSGSEEIR